MSNGNQSPDTLPADFFDKKQAPDTLPAAFFSSQGKPVGDKSTIKARPKGFLSWLQDLESDVRFGTGSTAPGRLLRTMGAPGIESGVGKESGEFMGGPVIGAVHGWQGLATIPSHPWQGIKQNIGGFFEATAIPGMLASGPEEGGAALFGKLEGLTKDVMAARKAGKTIEEWRKINKVLRVGVKGVRIGEEAKSLEQAATMPGRSLERAGFTAKKLSAMKPMERMMAIRPHLEQAGKAIETALQTEEKAGKVLDVGSRAFEVIKKIPNPKLQEQAIESFNYLAKELGIVNQRAATPTEAWKLRRALVAGARFGQGGDLNSLANIRGALYGAVSGDLKEAVPGLKELDQAFSDFRTAMNAARNAVSKEAITGKKPGLVKSIARGARREITERPIRTAALAVGIPYAGHEVVKHFSSHVPGE